MGDPEQQREAQDPGNGDGFVRLASRETVEAIQRELRAQMPKPVIPPMANIALVRELMLGGGERRVQVGATTYRVPPLGYFDGLELTRLAQDLDRALDAGRLLDRLADLRAIYRTLATLFTRLILPTDRPGWREDEDPFVRLTAGDFRELTMWLLEDGNENPVPPAIPRPDTEYKAYDASVMLIGYLTTVGHLPGWLATSGPYPASWRHYCAVREYLIRRDAQQQMATYMAGIMPQVADKDVRTRYFDDMQRRGA